MAGTFDRQAPKPQNTRGKIVLVAVLGVVLAGLLLMNLKGGTPREAGAAALAAPPRPVSPLSAQTLVEASNGERAGLLSVQAESLRNDAIKLALDQPPGNPFEVSPQWRKDLLRQVAIKPTEIVPVARPVLKTKVNLDNLRVQGVVRDAQQSYAIINGALARPGTVVLGLRVVDIRDDRIVFEPVGQGESARFDYPLKEAGKS